MKYDLDKRAKAEPIGEEARARAAVARLSPPEQTILVGVANGESGRSLAVRLEIPVSVIDEHRANLMRKLNAGSTADAVRIALLAGMGERSVRTNPR